MGLVVRQSNGVAIKVPLGNKTLITQSIVPTSIAATMNTSVFSFYVFPNNTSNSALIPITRSPQPLAYVQVTTGINKIILIRVSVGWRIKAADNETYCAVLFKIWRGEPVTGELVCSLLDGGESKSLHDKVTSFEHVDTGLKEFPNIVYTLTAQLASGSGAEVVGCLTMTALGLEG